MKPIKIFIGTVNYTDFLHVVVAKVSAPGTTVYETWIDMPVTNYVLVTDSVGFDNYYISFYDSPDDSNLGTLVSQCFYAHGSDSGTPELRFYKNGALPSGATLTGDNTLDDEYLVGKEILSVELEGFGRPLEETDEYTFDNAHSTTVGRIVLQGSLEIAPGGKLCVTIKNPVIATPSAGGGLYTSVITETASTRTLLAAEVGAMIRCKGSAATQVFTLPALSAVGIGEGFYFNNACGGTAIMPKILTTGADRVFYNGFSASIVEYPEFWVAQGEFLLLRKSADDYWEVTNEYTGINVGEYFISPYYVKNALRGGVSGATLFNSSEYGRLVYWLRYIQGSLYYRIDNAITGGGYTNTMDDGKFIFTSDFSQFRTPYSGFTVHRI